MTVDQIAELAKKELDAAEASVENAKRLLQEGALVGLGWVGGGGRGTGDGGWDGNNAYSTFCVTFFVCSKVSRCCCCCCCMAHNTFCLSCCRWSGAI